VAKSVSPDLSMDTIPFFDLKRQYANLKGELAPAIESVLEKTAFSGGEFADRFEKEFADYCGITHMLGVNSGTAAIHLALLALGIGPGDEVIVPAHTFIASATGISYTGAKPVFVDSLSDTWEIDPSAVEKAITEKTRAMIVVHLYGLPCELDELKRIAKEHELVLIEDCAQAHGALYKGRKVGSIGEVSAFSFYPSKNLGAYGEAGAVGTDEEKIAKLVEMLRSHGEKEKYSHEIVGYNERMDGIQGAVLSVKLRHLDAWNKTKRTIANRYFKGIENPLITLQRVPKEVTPAHHLFVVLVDDRPKFIEYLKARGVGSALHYPIPCHLQKAYRTLGYTKGDFPRAEHIADHCVSLPLFPELTDKEVETVIDVANGYL
jgi:dTDP-4-amino-4,6-dideoxygalactose transaminase